MHQTTGKTMEKFFNSSGPVKQDKHYTLDPLTRLDWDACCADVF